MANKKKKIISIVIIIFIVILLIYFLNNILLKKNRECLSYMENKYGEKFVIESKMIGFPSFMQKYFVFYGHAKKDKTMTFTGQYEFLDNNQFKIYDDYDVTLYAKQKKDEFESEMNKFLKEDFAVRCFPQNTFGTLVTGELEIYKENVSLLFLVFVKPFDYKEIEKYYYSSENQNVETFINDLINKYSTFISVRDDEIQYSSVKFIKTKNMRQIKNKVLTEPNYTFSDNAYLDYVYKDDNRNEESIQIVLK